MTDEFRVGPGPQTPAGWAEPAPAVARPRRRNRKPLIAGLLAVLALAAGGAVWLLWPSTVDIHGTLRLSSSRSIHQAGAACWGTGGYSDIATGAQMIVTDAAGKTVAVGQLGSGHPWGTAACEFEFSIDAPAGLDFYGVEVTHRGRVQYSAAQVADALSLTLGS